MQKIRGMVGVALLCEPKKLRKPGGGGKSDMSVFRYFFELLGLFLRAVVVVKQGG